VDEFELIRRYFARRGEAPGVVAGIGDDGAVLRPEVGRDLVAVADSIVGGVHFPHALDPEDIGYRAVAVNLSDIAAMGARPRWMTLCLTLPAAEPEWLGRFAGGLFDAAAGDGVALVGGDTTRGDTIVVSVQMFGDVAEGRAILRSGARPGDAIYVTGTVGDAAAGLGEIQAGKPDGALAARFRRPAPRVGTGSALVGRASAAIDVSDGLYTDLGKLLAASGVGADVELTALPQSQALRAAFGEGERRRLGLAGGEDYDLCFTAAERLPEKIAGVPVTRIGTVTGGSGIVLRDHEGVVDFDDPGYRHFR
jgi:thiamine-monophosphate kinase